MLTLNLKAKKPLEKEFKKLETLTEKPRNFHIKEAVIRYLKEANRLMKVYEQERVKGDKDYTIEKLLEHLNLK